MEARGRLAIDSFNWILPGQLAGSGRPGLIAQLEDDLAWLRSARIRHVVSLTREPLQVPPDSGFEIHHFPIFDMGIPTPRRAADLCRKIIVDLERRAPVLLHCKAGLGRTGTMLACSLVSLGDPAETAVARIRQVSSFYIQNAVQERFVSHYAEFLQEQEASGLLPEPLRAPEPRPVNPSAT